jgi:hypothetical protein
MRCLLAFLLTHIVGHSIISLLPYRDWADDLDLDTRPRRLPTWEERQELSASASADNPDPVTERVMVSCDSVWEFFRPWPSAEVRKTLTKRAAERREVEGEGEGGRPAWVGDWNDRGKFVVSWVGTRLRFQERVLGFDQSWTMFSPNVGKGDWVVRSRLLYADGTDLVVHSLADPEDLTRYRTLRLLSEKVLQYSLKMHKDGDRRLGYCNLLAHRHPANGDGSPLVTIHLIQVGYDYPSPGEDIAAELAAQNGPPDWEKTDPFFEYDVRSRKGRDLKK